MTRAKGAANAKLSPLELRIEVAKDLGNLRLELLKTFYDRRSVMERYLDNDIALHVHALTGEDGFCTTWRKSDDNRTDDSSKVPVFIGVGQIAKPSCPVASTERLQPLDSCDVFGGQGVTKVVSCEEFLELFFRICDRKLCMIYDSLGVKAGQLINQVVEGNAQVLRNLSDQRTDPQRSRDDEGGEGAPHCPNLPAVWQGEDSWLAIQGDAIVYSLAQGANLGLQILQVFPCPAHPLISAIQSVHEVYSDHERRQPAGRAEAENPEGRAIPSMDAP